MDIWLIFAFLSPLFQGVTKVIDKFLLDKHSKDSFSMAVYLNVVFFILSFFLILFVNFASPLGYILLAILIGVLGFFSFVMGFKAMSMEDVSVVTPILYIFPVFTILFAFLFLGEVVSVGQYAGAALLILSSVLIAFKRNAGKLAVSPALRPMMISVVLLGALVVMEKYALSVISPYEMIFWNNIGMLGASLVALALLPKLRKGFVALLKLKPKIASLAWLCNASAFVATLMFFFALSEGPATLVSSLNALQPFFVLAMVVLFSRFLPKILREEHTSRGLLLKVLAVLFVLIGSYLIAA